MLPINYLCQQYGLGQALTSPVELQGGLIHDMWHIQTTSGHYAIKRVNQQNLGLLSSTIMPISPAEALAQHYQQRGILARVACRTQSAEWSVYTEQKQCWMVFPWVEGRSKSITEISVSDAKQVGECLARLHAESIVIDNLSLPAWFGFVPQHWQELSTIALTKDLPWARFAFANSNVLYYWSERAQAVKHSLIEKLLVSHRDVSMSNIIWRDDGAPILIDWEYSGLVNPASDVFNTAMTWSNQLDVEIFNAIVNAAGYDFQMTDEKLLAGYAGYLMEWCEFNMQRSLIDADVVDIASGEVINVITILARLIGRGDRI